MTPCPCAPRPRRPAPAPWSTCATPSRPPTTRSRTRRAPAAGLPACRAGREPASACLLRGMHLYPDTRCRRPYLPAPPDHRQGGDQAAGQEGGGRGGAGAQRGAGRGGSGWERGGGGGGWRPRPAGPQLYPPVLHPAAHPLLPAFPPPPLPPPGHQDCAHRAARRAAAPAGAHLQDDRHCAHVHDRGQPGPHLGHPDRAAGAGAPVYCGCLLWTGWLGSARHLASSSHTSPTNPALPPPSSRCTRLRTRWRSRWAPTFRLRSALSWSDARMRCAPPPRACNACRPCAAARRRRLARASTPSSQGRAPTKPNRHRGPIEDSDGQIMAGDPRPGAAGGAPASIRAHRLCQPT